MQRPHTSRNMQTAKCMKWESVDSTDMECIGQFLKYSETHFRINAGTERRQGNINLGAVFDVLRTGLDTSY